MKRNVLTALALIALGACSTPAQGAAAPAACVATPDTEANQAWMDRALRAWRVSSREIVSLDVPANAQVIFFDASCAFTSANALGIPRDIVWSAAPVGETVPLPGGGELPVGVVSFASAEDGQAFFVMSLPSVWRDGGVTPGPLGLDLLMVAVMQHEASHIAQTNTYAARIGALSQANHLPDEFNDDSMQRAFESDAAFTASVQREIELFRQAAAAPERADALRLAREARGLMKARAARWFVGDQAYWGEAEDIWLTMEGSGQWLGYQWLISPHGGAVSRDDAMAGFGARSRWWSQNEGLAIALTLDRLGETNWRTTAFGDGQRTFLQMLDASLAG